MNLDIKANLSRSELFEIASTMHALVIDELFRQTQWMADDAVFHGGTALALMRESLRFSEDLDFMITAEAAAGLDRAVKRVRNKVALSMSITYPGSTIELKGPKGDEVHQWSFIWSHPNRRGTVKVLTEFLQTTRELLKAYKATHVVPVASRTIGVTMPVPVPELISAWADKIKAIATRPAFKWRDAYDLAFIGQCMDRGDLVEDRVKIEALDATASIYGRTYAEVVIGLQAVLEAGYLADLTSFETDMARWFEPKTFKSHQERGLFKTALHRADREVQMAISLSPANQSEVTCR